MFQNSSTHPPLPRGPPLRSPPGVCGGAAAAPTPPHTNAAFHTLPQAMVEPIMIKLAKAVTSKLAPTGINGLHAISVGWEATWAVATLKAEPVTTKLTPTGVIVLPAITTSPSPCCLHASQVPPPESDQELVTVRPSDATWVLINFSPKERVMIEPVAVLVVAVVVVEVALVVAVVVVVLAVLLVVAVLAVEMVVVALVVAVVVGVIVVVLVVLLVVLMLALVVAMVVVTKLVVAVMVASQTPKDAPVARVHTPTLIAVIETLATSFALATRVTGDTTVHVLVSDDVNVMATDEVGLVLG